MGIKEKLGIDVNEVVKNPIFIMFLIVFIAKIVLSFVGPFFSTDYARNLFYGAAFWTHGFNVYDLTPLDIDPDFDIRDPTTGELAYPFTAYDYPVVQILFWAIVSLFPFVVGKLLLTVIDAINFFLIRGLMKNAQTIQKEIISWSYFILVTAFSSVDGQPEVITLFIMLLVLHFMHKNPLFSFFLASIGFLWKYIPILMVLYLVIQFRHNKDLIIKGLGVFGGTSVILSIIPMLTSSYIFRYVLYAGDLPFGQTPSNPMAWNQIYLSSMILWGLLFYLAYYLYKNQDQLADFSILLPILLFLKYYQYAFAWYWVWLIPGLTALKNDEIRWKILKVFLILLPIATIEIIHLTAGFDFVIEFLYGS